MAFMQGILGNYSEKDAYKLTQEFESYLFANEKIEHGYQLIRDVLLFTNLRVIFVDKQGMSGKKTSIKSIYLNTIVDVEMETAGAGFDDSEITITYLNNVNQRSHNEVHQTHKFEFPKKVDVTQLYTYLGGVVLANRHRINS